MDPSQRLLLEVSYSVLCAPPGKSRESLMGTDTGIFVGVMTEADWYLVGAEGTQQASPFWANGAGAAAISGRLSFVLGLKGPCISVNTVCSSSLVALDIAVQNLQGSRCFSGLVASPNLMLHKFMFGGYLSSRALAPNGQCKTFDASANGLGRGEAVCTLLLEKTSQIPEAVSVLGSAVNQDGRSASMSAPNGRPFCCQLLHLAYCLRVRLYLEIDILLQL